MTQPFGLRPIRRRNDTGKVVELHPQSVQQQNTSQLTEWPEPIDFFAETEATGAPELQWLHIPEAIAPYVFDVAIRMGVDPSAVALSALVSLASVMSDFWRIQPKRFDTEWTERPCIWGALVGDPSILKTPVINAATKPVDRLEGAAGSRHEFAMIEYRLRMKEWKAAKQEGEEPKRPVRDRFMVEDITTETIASILRNDFDAIFRAPAGKVLVRRDEMSEWIASFDCYTSGSGAKDRGAYLRLYNGGRSTVDRKTTGLIEVNNWSACFLGGIQPGPIKAIAAKATDDGLLQRFCYCVPHHQAGGIDRKPDAAAVARYDALFQTLVDMHPPTFQLGAARPLMLTEEAQACRAEIDNLRDIMAALPDTSPRLKSAYGKWPGLWARLTLIFHLIDLADAVNQGVAGAVVDFVDRGAAARSTAYIRDILLPHLLRADRVMFSTVQSSHAAWIANHILSNRLEKISMRDVMRNYKALRAPEHKADRQGVMSALEDMGWVKPDGLCKPGQATSWTVNPKVHLTFSARAEAESERREIVKAHMQEAFAKRAASKRH